ncbi:Ionotropic receptor 263 [Blattella germanica]|nr:Ionotropic receptor 263 [Blattella germanica]
MLHLKLSFLLFYILGCSWALLTLYKENSIEEYLAECIINISTKYFDEDKPVLVETPTHWFKYIYPYNKYGGKFIELLHKANQFTLIIYGSEAYMAHLKVHVGSYIVLMPPVLRDIDNLYIKHMLGALSNWAYNSRGKIIVASLEQMASQEIRNLLTMAMKLELLHTILLKPRTLSQKLKDNHLDNIDIYNWFPNEQSNICSRTVNKINKSDTWISQTKMFSVNTNLFPSHRKIDFKGCTLRANFETYPPYSFVYPEIRGTAGPVVDIFVSIMKYINCIIIFIPPMGEDEYILHLFFPVTLDPIHYAQYERRDRLTYPHMVRDITWYVPKGKQHPRWSSLIKTFTSVVWYLVLLTFVFGSCTMWLLRKSERLGSNPTNQNNHGILVDAMLTHLGIGVVYRYKGFISSAFFMLWLYYCLIINTAYQSTFFGLLINPGHFPTLQTSKQVEESTLIKQTFGIQNSQSPFWSRFLKYKYCQNPMECFEALSKYQTHAILTDTWQAMVRVSMLGDNIGLYVPINEIVGTELLSIEINQLRGILLDVFNKVLGRFTDSGIINQMIERINRQYSYMRKNPAIGTAFSLTMDHLQVAFFFLLVGYVLSVSLNVFEFLFNFVTNWYYLLCIKYQLQSLKLLLL